MDNTTIFEKKRLAILGLLLGFSLSSFYYFFIIELLSFLFFLVYKFKLKIINELFNKYQYIIIVALVFLISISPFIIYLIYHESSVTERAGLFSLDVEKKSQLIDYYFSQYLKFKLRSFKVGDDQTWAKVMNAVFGSSSTASDFWSQTFLGVDMDSDFDPQGFFFVEKEGNPIGICAGIVLHNRNKVNGSYIGGIGWT